MGVYISALINGSEDRCFDLNLHRHQRPLHFLGFRLEKGKQLTVDGDLGHFSGAGLRGGYLNVNGSTGSWCGADMMSGHIMITGDALSKTGEQMKGGQIQVNGRIEQIAKSRIGGEIQSNGES
jgi:formylmethanofuran dehydrogenase subunit C